MMKKPSTRDLAIFAACAVLGVTVIGGAVLYKNHKNQIDGLSLTAPKVAVAVPAPPKLKEVYVLKNQPSPFSAREEGAKMPVSVANIPIPSVPSITVSSPGVGQRHSEAKEETKSYRSGLYVESVFLGSGGKNMAVLSNGKDSVTVREGQDSKFGYISGINRKGLYAGGAFVAVSKDAAAPPAANRAAGGTPLPAPPVEPPKPVENPGADILNPGMDNLNPGVENAKPGASPDSPNPRNNKPAAPGTRSET